MNLTYLSPLANHLWQSTAFAGIAGLLTLALGKNRARVRYRVWLAASCKFLIPLWLLMALGSHIHWRPAPEIARANVAIAMTDLSQPFSLLVESAPLAEAAPAPGNRLPAVLWGIWACGFLGISAAWWVRWSRLRTAISRISRGTPMQLELPLPVVCASTLIEPGVFGVFRPVLMLPDGIFERLTTAQLDAVIAHELCHLRHRDNLISAIHMFVETLFWFYPLVWWIGRRMLEERERACDEEVLQHASEPRTYAEAILGICKLYAESPLTCVSGVTGANLKNRIEMIMKNRKTVRLDFPRKVALAAAGVAAIVAPFAVGIVNAPFVRAQSHAGQKPLTFDVASVKHAELPDGARTHMPPEISDKLRMSGGLRSKDPGRIDYTAISFKGLLETAYDLKRGRISGLDWMSSEHYTINAKIPPGTTPEQFHLMLQKLLTERFQMTLHRESKEIRVYRLKVAKNGPKLQPGVPPKELSAAEQIEQTQKRRAATEALLQAKQKACVEAHAGNCASRSFFMDNATIEKFAESLSTNLDRPVKDMTGLKRTYAFSLEWAPENGPSTEPDDAPAGRSIFAAIQEQLGLRLEPGKENMDLLIVDKAEKEPISN